MSASWMPPGAIAKVSSANAMSCAEVRLLDRKPLQKKSGSLKKVLKKALVSFRSSLASSSMPNTWKAACKQQYHFHHRSDSSLLRKIQRVCTVPSTLILSQSEKSADGICAYCQIFRGQRGVDTAQHSKKHVLSLARSTSCSRRGG